MFLELIAVIFAGIAVAGVVMLINSVTGTRLPRWLAPVAAGLAMIAVTVTSEYSWYSRTLTSLPAGLVVADTVESRSFYRPWTYIVPLNERFVAVDLATMRSHPKQPDQHLAEVFFFGRWAPISQLSIAADCTSWRRAAVEAETNLAQDGGIHGVNWVSPPAEDHLLLSICGS
ncbi:hypothetical protein [Pseudophaeobacter arcticus]|jgi:hypothetical protein|uniref:hypothetical protein n=1 Tax=Pseudophaeobacter arcticus TaxID=385492 RepID=UPI0039E5B503